MSNKKRKRSNGAEVKRISNLMKFTEAGLLSVGKSAVCSTTIPGTRTIHRLGSQETRSKERILSIRYPEGQGGCCAW